MEQLALFAEAGQSRGLPTELLDYRPCLFCACEADDLLEKFIKNTPWKQTVQKSWDKEYLTPRLIAWYGDLETEYTAQGKVADPMP